MAPRRPTPMSCSRCSDGRGVGCVDTKGRSGLSFVPLVLVVLAATVALRRASDSVATVIAGAPPAVALRGTAADPGPRYCWPHSARICWTDGEGTGFGVEDGVHVSGPWLLQALRRDGFVTVELTPAESSTLDNAVIDFSRACTFRYPPRPEDLAEEDDSPAMPPPYQRCFDLLYSVAVAAASTLRGERLDTDLKPACAGATRPFEGSCGPWPYNASFFNIFNYDHGCLNTHLDRGVLTAVYSSSGVSNVPGQSAQGAAPSRLWLRVPARSGEGHEWLAPEPGQLLLWAGEGLGVEGVEAIEHCVRVDPGGSYIEHSHSTRDPEAPPNGNRRSVAFVLDE